VRYHIFAELCVSAKKGNKPLVMNETKRSSTIDVLLIVKSETLDSVNESYESRVTNILATPTMYVI
jgi:hypothetical protein